MNKYYLIPLMFLFCFLLVEGVHAACVTYTNNASITYKSDFCNDTLINFTRLSNVSIYVKALNAVVNITFINLSSNSTGRDIYSITQGRYLYADAVNQTMVLGLGDEVIAQDGGCDTIPVEDLTIGANSVKILCGGSYYLNDSNTNGVLRITGLNATILCNNTLIYGSNLTNSRAVDGNFNNGYTIDGCNFSGYKWCTYSSGTANVSIRNNVFGYAITSAISMLNNKNSSIYNNSFINVLTNAMVLESSPYDSTNSFYNVYNNYFINQQIAIKLQGTGSSRIYNNTIYNSTVNGIVFVATNTSSVFNNSIINSNDTALKINSDACYYNVVYNNFINIDYGHNCLDVQGRFNNFTGNYLNNCSHAGMNANSDYTDKVYSSNNYVANNIVNNSGYCMYFNSLSNSFIYNNSCYSNGLISDNNASIGIGVNGYFNSTTNVFSNVNNTYSDNLLYTYVHGIYEDSLNSSNIYKNNICYNCSELVYVQSFSATANNVPLIFFLNNSQFNIISLYNLSYNKNKSINVYDLSNFGSIFYFPSNSFVNKSYNGSINISASNSSFSILNQHLAFPFNDVKNVSDGVILVSNFDNYSLTLQPSQQIIIGNFTQISLNLTNYPSGILNTNCITFNFTINDPDNIFNYTTISGYYSNGTYLYSSNSTSLTDNSDACGIPNGNYNLRVQVYTNTTEVIDSGNLPFTISVAATPACNEKTNNIIIQNIKTAILLLMIIIAIILFWTMKSEPAKMVLAMGVLAVAYIGLGIGLTLLGTLC